MEDGGRDGGRERSRGRGKGRGRRPEPESVENEISNHQADNQVATAIQRMTELLARMVDQQGQGHGNNAGNPVNNSGNHEGVDRALERFQKFAPPKFIGEPSPDLAERWMDRMMDIFAALGYSEERQTPWTWVNFTREFNEKYLPPIVQERREEDFIRLRQGPLSVAEYETQFTKLSRFAPELVLTDRKRIRRFVQGLNVEIQEALAAAQLDTFSQTLEKAQRIETARSQVKAFRDKKRTPSDTYTYTGEQSSRSEPPSKRSKEVSGTRPVGTPNQGKTKEDQAGKGPQSGVSHGESMLGTRRVCDVCGATNHTEDTCWKKEKNRRCFRCGSNEHLVAQCPQKSRGGNKSGTRGNISRPIRDTK
ncbi:uncharacterized protein LOC113756607, partial [Coffea eugenioides]|uniref:uncharacterized protein LOC113756607 n=1 Tax=Coffea eugenioides TaxID=49369 RepID=UPI000F61329B